MYCTFTKTYYSKTSDSGPSEIGTVYIKPLYKVHCLRSQIFTQFQYIYNLWEEGNLSTKDKTSEFILSQTCPLFGGSTVDLEWKLKSVVE